MVPAVCICKSRRLILAAADGLPEKIDRINAHKIGCEVRNNEMVRVKVMTSTLAVIVQSQGGAVDGYS